AQVRADLDGAFLAGEVLLVLGLEVEQRVALGADLVQLRLLVLQVGREVDELAGGLLGLPELVHGAAVELVQRGGQGRVLGVLVAAQLGQVELGVGVVGGGLGQFHGVAHGNGNRRRHGLLHLALRQRAGELGQVVGLGDELGGVVATAVDVGEVVPVEVGVVRARGGLEIALGTRILAAGLAGERFDRRLYVVDRDRAALVGGGHGRRQGGGQQCARREGPPKRLAWVDAHDRSSWLRIGGAMLAAPPAAMKAMNMVAGCVSMRAWSRPSPGAWSTAWPTIAKAAAAASRSTPSATCSTSTTAASSGWAWSNPRTRCWRSCRKSSACTTSPSRTPSMRTSARRSRPMATRCSWSPIPRRPGTAASSRSARPTPSSAGATW